jgi:GTP-binding protein
MKTFVDTVAITMRGGHGGDGCVAFRREKYVPHGGPSGGDGGRGGSVILEASINLYTLLDFTYQRVFEAIAGKPGRGSNRHGANGQDLVVHVPVGTVVFRKDGEFLVDLNAPGQSLVVAQGGRGGRGNASFVTSTHRSPRLSERGDPGGEVKLRLELRLIADLGLIGKPNAGKSTLLAALSAATPKVADYPFSTLSPVLGTVILPNQQQVVLAEIPGLIEGASQGSGLGHEFLRHALRTRLLAYLLDLSGDPLDDFSILRDEVSRYDQALAERPFLVILTKEDLVSPGQAAEIAVALSAQGQPVVLVSALLHTHLEDLLHAFQEALAKAPPIPSQTPRYRIYTLEENDAQAFHVSKLAEGLFQVSSQIAERLVTRTDLTNEEAVRRLQKQLDRLGVEHELRRLGIQPSDTVRIGSAEFDYQENEGDEH